MLELEEGRLDTRETQTNLSTIQPLRHFQTAPVAPGSILTLSWNPPHVCWPSGALWRNSDMTGPQMLGLYSCWIAISEIQIKHLYSSNKQKSKVGIHISNVP